MKPGARLRSQRIIERPGDSFMSRAARRSPRKRSPVSTSETDTDQSHDGTAEHVVQLLCEYIEEVEERIGERLATLPSCDGALRTDVSQTVVR